MTNIPFYMVNFSFINQHYYFPKLNLENSFNFKVKWNHHLNELSVRRVIGTILWYESYRTIHTSETTFGPPEFLFEINHHVIEFRFWSTLNISNSLWVTWSWTLRIPLLVHFHLFELDQKQVFGQLEGGLKAKFDHVIIYFKEKFRWTKSETACICVTWLSPPKFWTGSKIGPALNMLTWKRSPSKAYWSISNDPSSNLKWTQLELSFFKKSFIII